jgi:hypothetical protein
MIIAVFMLGGGIWGGLHARMRGGKGFDIAQYAAVWGIIGALLGVVTTILVERML